MQVMSEEAELPADDLRIGVAWRELRRGAAMQRMRDLYGDELELGQVDALDLVVQQGQWRMGELAEGVSVRRRVPYASPDSRSPLVYRLSQCRLPARRPTIAPRAASSDLGPAPGHPHRDHRGLLVCVGRGRPGLWPLEGRSRHPLPGR